jgi:glycosyltransferase involved in cell wall biosynthesis
MRLLHSIRSVDPQGGGPIEGIKLLSRFHLNKGREIEVVCLDEPEGPGVQNFEVPIHPLGPCLGNYGYNPRIVPWLRENISRFDAVIVNGLWQYSGFAVWRALRKSSIPYFVFTHGMLDPWFKETYPLKHLKKWLYWPWGEYRVLRDAQAVLFTCEEERLRARKSFWFYRCKEQVVTYGTTPPLGNPSVHREAFFQRFPELRGKQIFLFMSRIHPKKGIELLLEAFSKVLKSGAGDPNRLHLLIAGPAVSPEYLSQLKEQANAQCPLGSVSWPGMLQRDLKWGAFRAADAFILPSHQENFGVAVAESLACSLPVLISDKVNIWREIEGDGAGFVETDTVEGTRRLIERWLALPFADKEKMRSAAERCFANRFDAEAAAENLIQTLVSCGVPQHRQQELVAATAS